MTGTEFVKLFNKLETPLGLLAVALRDPKAVKALEGKLRQRPTKRAVETWMKFGQWMLAQAQKQYQTKKFFKGTEEARKFFLQQLQEGKADWADLKRNLNPGAPNFVKLLVKAGLLLQRRLNAKPSAWVPRLRDFLTVIRETLVKIAKVKNALKPKKLVNQVMDYLDRALTETVPLRDLIEEALPARAAKQLLDELGLKLPDDVVKAFRRAAARVKVGKYKLSDVVDEEGALVLRVRAGDIKFSRDYVVFYHPSLLFKEYRKMKPQQAARRAEKMAATVANLAALLRTLKKDYKNLYGADLRVTWRVVPVEETKELTVLPTHELSAEEIIDRLTDELKEAHGEVAKVKSLVSKGETIYLENEEGEYEPAKVVKVNKDGTIVVKIGKQRRTINPMEDHFLTEEEYARLTGGGRGGKLTEELTEEELKALEELGIKLE